MLIHHMDNPDDKRLIQKQTYIWQREANSKMGEGPDKDDNKDIERFQLKVSD